MHMHIPDKTTFKRLSAAGLLGNTFRQWDTLAEMESSGYQGFVTVRSRKASDKRLFIPVIDADLLRGDGGPEHDVGLFIVQTGLPTKSGRLLTPGTWLFHCLLKDVYFQEVPPPDTGRIINLEAARTPFKGHLDPAGRNQAGLYVRYSLFSPLNLRHDLEQNGQDAEGVAAHVILRDFLQEDVDVLWDIWDRYPDAVIEATRFSVPVGAQDSKLVLWEVWDY